MDAALYVKLLADESITDLAKISHKYPEADLSELVELMKAGVYQSMPLPDFAGNDLVYMANVAQVRMNAVKLLLTPQSSSEALGLKAMEDEVASSLALENISFSRNSIKEILRGYAPANENESRIYGLKKGLEFISDPANEITEESIHALYDLAIGQYLPEGDRLRQDAFYRHDMVFAAGQEGKHVGLAHDKLPEYMGRLVDFVRTESRMNDLLKAAVIHFYITCLQPYFAGSGCMARLLHLWYLKRQGYASALFIPFSGYVERSRKDYSDAYALVEENTKISGMTDVTPFLVYFAENVYNKLGGALPQADTLEVFRKALNEGKITEKEKDLWNFVLSTYAKGEFSTKQLERDFGRAAYATIRGFALKFAELGLLRGQKYGNKVKYSAAIKINRRSQVFRQ